MGERSVVVTGLGVTSPFGIGVHALRQGLLEGRTGIGPITLFDAGRMPATVAAEVPGLDDDAVPGDPRYHRIMNRAMKLAVVAAAEAVASAGLDTSSLSNTACIAGIGRHDITVPEFKQAVARGMRPSEGTTASGFLFDRTLYLSKGVRALHPLWLLTFIPNLAVAHIAAAVGIRGETNTLTTEGAAGLQAVAEGAASIREGLVDVALCGGCDSRIHPIGIARSLALGTLAETDRADACRPFDRTRFGTITGEGAAFLVLEEAEHARRRGASVLAEVAGWGEAGDAYDPRAVHPEGRGLRDAMSLALERAGSRPQDVDLVVACASSLVDLDAAESAALGALFDPYEPLVTAPAGALGRSHAAAGALAASAALVAISEQSVPPTLNTTQPFDGAPRGLVTGDRAVARSIGTAVVNGFAIGGESASLVLRRVES